MSRRSLGLWGPLVAYALAIFLVSDQENLPGMHIASDKLLHALAYAGFAALAYRALHGGTERLRWTAALAALALTAAYGAMDEVHQAFVPGRLASAADWLADLAGGGVGTLLMALYARLGGISPPPDGKEVAR